MAKPGDHRSVTGLPRQIKGQGEVGHEMSNKWSIAPYASVAFWFGAMALAWVGAGCVPGPLPRDVRIVYSTAGDTLSLALAQVFAHTNVLPRYQLNGKVEAVDPNTLPRTDAEVWLVADPPAALLQTTVLIGCGGPASEIKAVNSEPTRLDALQCLLVSPAFLRLDTEAGERVAAAAADALFYVGGHQSEVAGWMAQACGQTTAMLERALKVLPALAAPSIQDVRLDVTPAEELRLQKDSGGLPIEAHLNRDLVLRSHARFKGYFDPAATHAVLSH
jgi:hypothetical protein